VISPGLLTTVQDLGRPGYAHLGISACGAADALSLRAGNLLAGNAEGAAALEITLAGGIFEFEFEAVVALTGADFAANIPMWTAVGVKAGEQVRCGHARWGARGYLCVRGGVEVPLVLGSASTHVMTGLGGLEGRALKRGDVVACSAYTPQATFPRRCMPGGIGEPGSPVLIRVTAPTSARPLCGTTWEVQPDSDRMGVRLRGPGLERHTGEMLTEGAPLGAIQVPPDGQPIILFVEHQTTGGYPKIANVISADLHALGQLRAREQVRFEQVSMDAALTLLEAQEEWLYSVA